jgi:hypothetical protein
MPAYAKAGTKATFYVGQPSEDAPPSGHAQGMQATGKEIAVAEALGAEAEAHGDMKILPYRDSYRDLFAKTETICPGTPGAITCP